MFEKLCNVQLDFRPSDIKMVRPFHSRGRLRGHVNLLVMLVWIASVLLLSRNMPWPNQWSLPSNVTSSSSLPSNVTSSLPPLNQTTSTEEPSAVTEVSLENATWSPWWPPIFGLDNVHMWPIMVRLHPESFIFV